MAATLLEGFQLADGTAVTLRLAHERMGPPDAPAWLLLHGYAGSHHALAPSPDAVDAGWAMSWAGPGKPLDTSRVQVITVNHPGSAYGSGWRNAADSHASVRDMARAIVALLDRWSIATLAGAIGYSFGGYVALQLKADWPDRVDRVLGLCTGLKGRGSLDELARLRALTEPAQREAFRRNVLMGAGLREWGQDQGGQALERELSTLPRWAEQFGADALWRLRAAALGFDVGILPPRCSLLYSSTDTLFPPPDPMPAHAGIVETCYGHQSLLLDPRAWVPAIDDWLQGRQLPGSIPVH